MLPIISQPFHCTKNVPYEHPAKIMHKNLANRIHEIKLEWMFFHCLCGVLKWESWILRRNCPWITGLLVNIPINPRKVAETFAETILRTSLVLQVNIWLYMIVNLKGRDDRTYFFDLLFNSSTQMYIAQNQEDLI